MLNAVLMNCYECISSFLKLKYITLFDRNHHCHLVGYQPPGFRAQNTEKKHGAKSQKQLPEEEVHLDQHVNDPHTYLPHTNNGLLGNGGQFNLPVEIPTTGFADVSDACFPFLLHLSPFDP